jgi:uncharacterized protein (DUF58 family)
MKKSTGNQISGIRPGMTFWGLIVIAGFLLITRLLFDEVFFLNSLYVIGFYLLGSFLYVYFVLDGLSIERKSRYKRRQVGELFEETILITNNSIFPVHWLQIMDLSDISTSHSNRVIGLLPGRHTRMIRESSFLQKRGRIILTPFEVISSDPLGCFSSKRIIETTGSVIVLPYKVTLLAGKVLKDKNDEGDFSRQVLNQTSVMNNSVREYVNGDTLNRIHWPTTAKKGTLFTRLADIQVQKAVWILMDCNKGVHYRRIAENSNDKLFFLDAARLKWSYSQPADTMEAAVSITSSLAVTFLKMGISVGLAFNGEPIRIFLPGVGTRQQSILLEALTYIQPHSCLSISSVLSEFINQISIGSKLFLVTPDDSVEFSSAVQKTIRKRLIVNLIYINRMSFQPDFVSEGIRSNLDGVKTFKYNFGDPLTKLHEVLM